MQDSMRVLFGKKELEIIAKQQKNIKLNATEKTTLSGPIKKKIRAIESYAPLNLQKGSLIISKINSAVDAILSDSLSKNIKRIYIYGSHCKGKAHAQSDIDLAIDIPTENSLKTAVDIEMLLPDKNSDLFDVQILENLPFREEIEKNGKLIYSSSRGKIPIKRLFEKNEPRFASKRSYRSSSS